MKQLPAFKIFFMLAACFSTALFANTSNNRADKPQISAPAIQTFKATPKIPTGSRGQLLYENHCTVCHDSGIHIREHRKVRSQTDIKKWVFRWSQHLKLDWSNAEINDVADFLNQQFYQLPKVNINSH